MRKYFYLLALVMILFPFALRLNHNATLAGNEPYFHSRMAVEMLNGIPQEDSAIVSGRPYMFNPYHLVLSLAIRLTGSSALFFTPAVFAFLSVILFSFILDKLNLSEKAKNWSLLVYALSPPLIASSFLNTPRAFVLFLIMAGILSMLKNQWFVSLFFCIIATWSGGFVAAVISLLFLASAKLVDLRKAGMLLLGISIAFSLGLHSSAIPESGFVSDLGGTYGLSLFGLLLAVIGAVMVWKTASKSSYLLPLAVLIFPGTLIIANVIVSVLAGIALAMLSARKWDLDFIRDASLLVLFCGLLFSGISQATNLARFSPNADFFEVLDLPSGIIISDEKYGFLIEAAGHKAVADPLMGLLSNSEAQISDGEQMLSSSEIDKTGDLMEKYNVSYALITQEMREGLVWERGGLGLDFLVENSEKFKRISGDSKVEVWRFS